MSTLYELTGDYMTLLDMMQNCDELDEKVLKDTLDGIEGEIDVKAENYAKIIKELTLDAKKYEEEKKRLEANQKSLENKANRLRDHLYKAMLAIGKTKIKTDLFSFRIQSNGGEQPVVIIPDVEIPPQFLKIEPDNKKIREALKKGEELPFATLKDRGTHLVIK